jgi:hypothetical protein
MAKKQEETNEVKVGLENFMDGDHFSYNTNSSFCKITVYDDLYDDDSVKTNVDRVKGKDLFTVYMYNSTPDGWMHHRLDGFATEIHDEEYMSKHFKIDELSNNSTIDDSSVFKATHTSKKFKSLYAVADNVYDNRKKFEQHRIEFLRDSGVPNAEMVASLFDKKFEEATEMEVVPEIKAAKPTKALISAVKAEKGVAVAGNTATDTTMDKFKKTVKSDLGHVAKRVAVKKTSEFAQKAILDLLASNKTKDQASKLRQQFTAMLSTEDGRAAFNIVVGTILPLISGKMPENLQETIEGLAQEFRTDGMSHFAIEFVDYLSGDGAEKLREVFQKNLEAIREGDVTKIRVSTETPSLHELIAPAKKALDFVVDEKVEKVEVTKKN